MLMSVQSGLFASSDNGLGYKINAPIVSDDIEIKPEFDSTKVVAVRLNRNLINAARRSDLASVRLVRELIKNPTITTEALALASAQAKKNSKGLKQYSPQWNNSQAIYKAIDSLLYLRTYVNDVFEDQVVVVDANVVN